MLHNSKQIAQLVLRMAYRLIQTISKTIPTAKAFTQTTYATMRRIFISTLVIFRTIRTVYKDTRTIPNDTQTIWKATRKASSPTQTNRNVSRGYVQNPLQTTHGFDTARPPYPGAPTPT